MSINRDTIKKLEKISGKVLSFAVLIHAIRQGEEMTQVDFAKMLGVSKQYLCDVEHGRRLVSPKVSADWADKLGYSVAQFVRLSIQDTLNRDQLKLLVTVEAV